jgi:hypothetical protein
MSKRKPGFGRKMPRVFLSHTPTIRPRELDLVCAIPACPRSTPNYPICGICRRCLGRGLEDELGAAFRGLRSSERLENDGEAARRRRAYNAVVARAVKAVIERQMRLDEEKWAA